MLCWVTEKSKKELLEASTGKEPIYFYSDEKEFSNEIKEGDFCIISMMLLKTDDGLNSIRKIIDEKPNISFFFDGMDNDDGPVFDNLNKFLFHNKPKNAYTHRPYNKPGLLYSELEGVMYSADMLLTDFNLGY